MDSLSQIVLGAAVANAVAGKQIGNRALLYGAIVGTIPDLDVLALFFTDHLTGVEFHRTLTHSVFFAFIASFFLGYILFLLEKKRDLSFSRAYWLVFLGLFTHSLLDIFTTWGTALFWPLPYYFAFKSIFVIDPLYTLPFLYFLVRSALCKNNWPKRRYFNTLALVVSSAYLLIALGLKAVVYSKFKKELAHSEIAYENISVKPSALNTILWNAIIQSKDGFYVSDYSFFDTSRPLFTYYAKNHYLADSIKEEEDFQRLVRLSEGDYVLSQSGDTLFFHDLRFGLLKNDPLDPQFGFSYALNKDQKGDLIITEVVKDRSEGVKMLQKLWIRIQGR
ncbi:metal-dependent hydrolase [Myroides sp. LJL116]